MAPISYTMSAKAGVSEEMPEHVSDEVRYIDKEYKEN